MMQTDADVLGTLLGWDGAAMVEISAEDRAASLIKLEAAGVVESEGGEWYVIDPAQTAQDILSGMDRGELVR
jgi:hypothetical protein